MKLQYVHDTKVFEDRSFDPRVQTAIIDSDLGLSHRFGFGNVSLSARRRQFLAEDGRVDLTLPSVNLSFSPVTLFRAPRSRQGAFSNLNWSGSLNFSRTEQTRDLGTDTRTTNAGATSSFTLRQLNLSGSVRFNDLLTVPADSLGNDLDDELRSTLTWNVGMNYRIGLIGSTTLRPRISVDGARFRSDDTSRDFIAVPTRFNIGDLLTLIGAAFIGIYIAMLDRFAKRHDSAALALTQVLAATLVFLIVWPLTEPIRWPPREIWLALAVTGIISTAAGSYVQTHVQQRLSAVRVTVIIALTPVFAALFGRMLADERLTAVQAVGAVLMIGAVMLVEVLGRNRKQAGASP